MKRSGSSAREENYEHVLMCLICRSLFDDYDHQPKFLPCHHTFCKDCLREYIRQLGDEIECPSCRKIATIPAAGVAALQTNFYVKYIQALVCGPGGSTESMQCSTHEQQTLSAYCTKCQAAVCTTCIKNPEPSSNCTHPATKPLTTITEESHQLLDSTFAKASATIDNKKVKLETLLKGLSNEKDDALKKIDSCFEQHVHTLNRRATLLKNKVIDIFSESVEKLENDLMEISTALTCVVSLKDYHENKISHGDFKDFKQGITEITEVNTNIEDRIRPNEVHIHFEGAHGTDKFRMGVKDLGRVRVVRTLTPRAEPDGKDGGATQPASTPPSASAASGDPNSSSDIEKDGGESTNSDVIVPSPSSSVASTPPQKKQIQQTPSESSCKVSPNDKEAKANACTPKYDKPGGADTKGGAETKGGVDTKDSPNNKTDVKNKSGIPVSKKATGCDQADGVVQKELKPGNCSKPGHCTSTPQPKPKQSTSPNTQRRDDNLKKSPQGSSKEGFSETPKPNLISGVDKNANAKPNVKSIPDLHIANANIPEVARRKVDKDYYHTVYTSYDEEELLKELRATPRCETLTEVDDDSETLCERQTSKGSNMEDSDGWMTLSSGDENGDVIDEIIPEDELTTL